MGHLSPPDEDIKKPVSSLASCVLETALWAPHFHGRQQIKIFLLLQYIIVLLLWLSRKIGRKSFSFMYVIGEAFISSFVLSLTTSNLFESSKVL